MNTETETTKTDSPIDLKELWGEELYKAFKNHIEPDGWLTTDYPEILENNFSNWDEDYNDIGEKSHLYSLMYNTDFEENESGRKLRPIVVLP